MNHLGDDPGTKYDAYLIHNEPGKKFKLPENFEGAIGVTIDDKLQGLVHSGLKVFNSISAERAGINPIDPNFNIDLTNTMHAFTLLGRGNKTAKNESNLKVAEAIGSGITEARISMGDNDWTSMVLFVPRDARARTEIIANSHTEIRPDKAGNSPSYGFVAGVVSIFSEKIILSSRQNKEVIASEMADYLKGRGVKNKSGGPREAICSQLATRILRASTMLSQIPQEKMREYTKLDKADLIEKFVDEMTLHDSPLAKEFWRSNIYQMPVEFDALPFELYVNLMNESQVARNPSEFKTFKAEKKDTAEHSAIAQKIIAPKDVDTSDFSSSSDS